MKTSDFVPTAFFVFVDYETVTYSWVFKIRKEDPCHVSLKTYMGKSIASLDVYGLTVFKAQNFIRESV